MLGVVCFVVVELWIGGGVGWFWLCGLCVGYDFFVVL